MTSSILSFKERGHWGDSRYRGNTSGHVVKTLLDLFKPSLFVDPSEGSGTSRDVAKEAGVDYVGLDLRTGFNILKDRLLDRLPRTADFVFYHPAYYNIIKYSGEVWGSKPHPDDLSRCSSPEDFIEKLQVALYNIYDAISHNGRYSVLIGDVRQDGWYWSIQADIIQMAPGKLDGVMIKEQHNTASAAKKYNGNFVPILHEYLLNFKKDRLVVGMLDCAVQATKRATVLNKATWKAIVETALRALGKKASLSEIYGYVSETAQAKTLSNKHWQEKIRQVLQLYHTPVERGIWQLQAA